MAIERTTSKTKIEVISRVWSSCLQCSQSCRKLDPRKRTQQVPRSRTRLPALPKTRTQTNGTTINSEKCASNMMQNMYDMQDMICDAYACSGKKDEQGSNLENQACHWKDEMISVEIDIKITGNGCTVCKWQAKQEWHESAINSMIALRMHQVTMLQHSNIATKHMAVIYRRCLTKYKHWATARSHHNRYKQAWQKCKRYQVHRLGINSIR